MTHLAPGAHPSPEEVDALLDIPGGTPDDVGQHAVATHLAGCGTCQEVAESLREVRRLLRDEGRRTPPPPADLGRRLATALARASAERDGTVVPLRVEHASGERGTRNVPRWVSVAAVLTVLGGSAVAATQLMGQGSTPMVASGGADSSAEAGAGGGAAAAASPVSTGTDYQRAELATQVGDLVEGVGTVPLQQASPARGDEGAGAPEAAAEDFGAQPVLPGSALPDADEPLVDPSGLQGCLEAIGAAGTVPLAVDLASFEGQDAAVIVLPGATAQQVEVWVVARDCRPGAEGLLEFQRVDTP